MGGRKKHRNKPSKKKKELKQQFKADKHHETIEPMEADTSVAQMNNHMKEDTTVKQETQSIEEETNSTKAMKKGKDLGWL